MKKAKGALVMKRIIIFSLAIGTASLASINLLKNQKVEIVKAYDKSSLPTTIDLNSISQSDIRNYYSSLLSLDDSEKTGENLLKNLKPILSNNQKYYSYDISNGTDIWKIYEITDRDWDKSPASEISGYDPSTNIITGYSYGSSASKSGTNPYIHALYVNRDVDNNVRAWAQTDTTKSSHGNNAEWCIDREHIWPKSHGFDDTSNATSGARGDPMHLWPGDSYVNSALHSNYFYGYVDKNKDYTDGKDKYSYDSGNYVGTSLTVGSGKVFEPQDSDKGDIARAVFYMVARYNNIAGNDSSIDTDNPNLTLSDVINNDETGTSTYSKSYNLGVLSDLLKWNKLDPVDEFEIKRNDLLYKNYTNNRNPFIDFPEWADYIWGEERGISFADPSNDSINGSALKVTTSDGQTFTGNLDLGSTTTISVNADNNTSVEWKIEDETIASINTTDNSNSITIKALKVGSTKLTIKATINSKEETKEIVINVVDPSSKDNTSEFKLDIKTIIIIAVAALIALVIIILFMKFASKKTKKKAKKVVKSAIKSSKKSNGKKK